MKITWLQPALDSFSDVVDYSIEYFGTRKAANTVNDIYAAVEKLEQFPSIGTVIPESINKNNCYHVTNIDKLFDKGYITFDKRGMMICSKRINSDDKEIFGIDENSHLTRIEDMHLPYLIYHQDNCFLG